MNISVSRWLVIRILRAGELRPLLVKMNMLPSPVTFVYRREPLELPDPWAESLLTFCHRKIPLFMIVPSTVSYGIGFFLMHV